MRSPKMENETIEPVVLTTTLYRLRRHHACESRYSHLVGALGPEWGDNTPINLLAILKHNGIEDCLWALCATDQNCDMVERLMEADFAETVLPIYERDYPGDTRPRAAIQAARDYAHGRIGDAARAAAMDAAWAAAGAAAMDAAMAAARAAAMAAAWDAAWAAARDAAMDAAWAAAWDAQADIIRRYLRANA